MIVTLTTLDPAVVASISQSRAATRNGTAASELRNEEVRTKAACLCNSSGDVTRNICGPTVQPGEPLMA